ncbi:MAG: metallophosphoesterase family protein [Acidobacteria bacterium]|nr:metallophosphoesterase family protein [Acidobacteriota bacterium]
MPLVDLGCAARGRRAAPGHAVHDPGAGLVVADLVPPLKILVFADVHGNAEALAAVLEKESDVDATIFLGDTVLSGPQPNETMALLADLDGILIEGNHDVEMFGPERFEGWPAPWRAYTNWILDTLEPAGWELLRGLKSEGEYEVGGQRVFLHHGVLPDEPRQALPDTPDERLGALAGGTDCPMVLFGHSHIQFCRSIGGQEFINPGSVGQPRCGRRVACYGLIEDGVFRHCQVDYDPGPWLEALADIRPLDGFPEFREWLKKALLGGYGIGEREPWTRFAREGYV